MMNNCQKETNNLNKTILRKNKKYKKKNIKRYNKKEG